jgi:AcrR family transcriptional regulator
VPTVTDKSVRRTQAERRTTTQHALLDATVQCLVDVGYSRTTTTEICARAGVSQGALFRHYPTKQALLAAAAEHLYELLLQGFRGHLGNLGSEATGLDSALGALWRTFERPELAAAYELHVAARTDEQLRELLGRVTNMHATSIRRTAADLFPEAATDERFARLLDTVLETFQGMAISRMITHDRDHEERVLEALRLMILSTFPTEVAT